MSLLFLACCFFIMGTSVHDAVLVVLHVEVIADVEENPLGRWLILLQKGEMWLFVWAKLAGTALVGATLITIYDHRRRWAWPVAVSLAVLQAVLLAYLTIG